MNAKFIDDSPALRNKVARANIEDELTRYRTSLEVEKMMKEAANDTGTADINRTDKSS